MFSKQLPYASIIVIVYQLMTTISGTETNAAKLKHGYKSYTVEENAFLEYVKGPSLYQAFYSTLISDETLRLLRQHFYGISSYSKEKFQQHLAQKFEAHLATLHLMREHWHCANIMQELGESDREACVGYRYFVDIVHEYLFYIYIIDADPTLAEQLPVVKPKFEAHNSLRTMLEMISSLSDLSRFFFDKKEQLPLIVRVVPVPFRQKVLGKLRKAKHFEQKDEKFSANFGYDLERYFRSWTRPELLNNEAIKYTQNFVRITKMEPNNRTLKNMLAVIAKTLKADPFFDQYDPIKYHLPLTSSASENVHPKDDAEQMMLDNEAAMRQQFSAKLAQCFEELEKVAQHEIAMFHSTSDSSAIRDKYSTFFASPFTEVNL